MKVPSSFAAFRVEPLDVGGLQAFRDAVEKHAFRPCLPNQEQATGWCDAADPSLGPTDIVIAEPWIALGVRVDKKTIPAALLKLQVAVKVREWEEDHGRKCPAAVRKEFEEAIKLDLRVKTPAAPTTGILLFDAARGRVYVGAHSGAVLEAASSLWRKTTSGGLQSISPLDGVLPELDEEDRELLTAGMEEGCVASDQLGRFLAWLWWKGEASTSDMPSVLRAADGSRLQWLCSGDGIHLADRDTGKRRISVRASEAAKDPVLRVGIADGHHVDGLTLALHVDDLWRYDVTLAIKDSRLVVSGFKTAKLNDADKATALVLIGQTAEDIVACVDDLFRAWSLGPGRASAQGQASHALTVWLTREIDNWREDRLGGEAGQ